MSGTASDRSSEDTDRLSEFAEIAVGAAILGLRRFNTSRRELVERVPAIEPAVDAVLGCIDDLTEPVSDAFGAAVTSVGDAIGGSTGDRVAEAGRSLSKLGPQLLKISGLTHRG